MDTVEINFWGFWEGFDVNDNNIIRALSKNFNVKISDNPDFVFYSFFQSEKCPFSNHIKIFYSEEAYDVDLTSYNYLITCKKILMPISSKILFYHYIPTLTDSEKTEFSPVLAKRKFCNFVYHNLSLGNNARRRIEFCKELSKYKTVDCPGVVLNNMKGKISDRNGNWQSGKLEFIKDYKFTIAFENIILPGYSTEKIYHPLLVKSVPIYSGDPGIKKYYNSKAFINVDDYSTWDQAIEEIIRLDNDDDLYLDMVKESEFIENCDYDKQLEKFLYRIVKIGNSEDTRNPKILTSNFIKF